MPQKGANTENHENGQAMETHPTSLFLYIMSKQKSPVKTPSPNGHIFVGKSKQAISEETAQTPNALTTSSYPASL